LYAGLPACTSPSPFSLGKEKNKNKKKQRMKKIQKTALFGVLNLALCRSSIKDAKHVGNPQSEKKGRNNTQEITSSTYRH
jgi:hypothetical protein